MNNSPHKKRVNLNFLIFKSRIKSFYEAIFIHWITALIGIGIVFINFLIFGSDDLVIKFPEINIQINITETLSRIISVFLGIIFSLIILSYNIFSKYFGRFAFNVLFKNKGIKFLFTLFIFTLTFLLYSLSYLKGINKVDTYGNSLFILSIMFSSTILFSIFPVANKLMKDSQNRTNIKQLINKLNIAFEDTEFIISHDSTFQITTSPEIMLIEIGTISIKDFDYTTTNLLLEDIENNFKKEFDIKESIYLRALYHQSNDILKKLFSIAVKERNENAINKIIYARLNIETHVINNIDEIKLHDFENKYLGWDFNNTFQDFFNRAVQFNEDRACKLIIDSYRDFISTIIKSYLPSRFDYIPNDWQTYRNETSFIQNIIADVSKFVSISFTAKKHYLFQNLSNLYSTLELVTLDSGNTEMGKVFILNLINNWKYESFENYLDSGCAQIETQNYPFGTLSTTHAIKEIKCDIPFLYSLKAVDLLFAKEKLNSMAINSIKAEAFYLINNFEANNINKKMLLIIFKEFEKLSSYITISDNDYRKDIYLKLDRYLEYINKQLIEKNITDTDINKAMIETKKCFSSVTTFQKELKDKGYISNDKIV